MRRTVIGLFKSLEQAENALRKIETLGLANNQISIVLKKPLDLDNNDEYVEEISLQRSEGILHDFDGFLVQADDIELPDLGTVSAAGPLAGALLQEDKSLLDVLSYYGVDAEHALELEKHLQSGYVLTLIETNNEKANEVTNILSSYGGHQVLKWSKNIAKPLRPWN